MANKKYNRKTNEEKLQEIKNLSEKALEEIKKYTTSPEHLLEYAEFLSRFHSYSLNNMSLIQNQFRGAIAVASFKDWKDKGYSVNKGEKGIDILSYAPITLFKDSEGNYKQISAATKEEKEMIKEGKIETRKINNYKKGHVFDISQTNAPVEDLPKIFPNKQFNFNIEDSNNADLLLKGIRGIAKNLNIEIKDMKDSSFGQTELGTAKGMFIQNTINTSQKEILLNSRNTPTQNLATAIHELAHAKMHYIGSEMSENVNKATLEFQAELTSYIICKHYGMDTSEKAIPYIAKWTNNGEKLEEKQKALEGVHKTAKEFIDIMDTVITQEKELTLNSDKSMNYHDENINQRSNHHSSAASFQSVDKDEMFYPIDPDEAIYCNLSGRAIAQDEGYYHLANGMILSEEAKNLVFTDKEWDEIYTEEGENYWATCYYDLDQSEMTNKEPEPILDKKNEYYFYDGQSKPVKLGTVNDIVSRAEKQEMIGHFSLSHDFIKEFAFTKDAEKEDFNFEMKKYNVLKNPDIKDFQRVNITLGLDKNSNLSNLELTRSNRTKHLAHMQQLMER